MNGLFTLCTTDLSTKSTSVDGSRKWYARKSELGKQTSKVGNENRWSAIKSRNKQSEAINQKASEVVSLKSEIVNRKSEDEGPSSLGFHR